MKDAATRGGQPTKRMFKCFAILLAVVSCMMWYINIVSIQYLDSAYTTFTSSSSSWPRHPYLQKNSNMTGIKSTHTNGPILIPSHNRKFHLKEILAQDLESTLTIYPNNTYSIQKDISSYLSFAIIGMSKTGTTSLLKMLSNSTSIIQKERCDLVVDDVPLLLNSLYNIRRVQSSRKNKNNVTGIKCPQDISSMKSIQNYKQYFHQTKLIVGIRHPIMWFESLYNFNVRNMNQMAPTKKLERCIRGSHGVCAWRANVADFLRQLNKTPMEEDELEYMNLKESKFMNDNRRVGPVFLYEVNQLKDSESECERNNDSFGKDLADFIGIEHDLPRVPHITTAGVLDFVSGVKEFSQSKMIDICDEEHAHIRSILLDKAKSSSEWILKYFLQSHDVRVSSRNCFIKHLEKWKEDPCTERRRTPINSR